MGAGKSEKLLPERYFFGAPKGIRTPGTRLRRPLLYPTELWALNGLGDSPQAFAVNSAVFVVASSYMPSATTRISITPIVFFDKWFFKVQIFFLF